MSTSSKQATETPPERIVRIADRPRTAVLDTTPETGPASAWAWLLPIVFLAAIVAGVAIVLRAPGSLFGWAFGALVGGGLAWIVVSTFFPAKADRVCSACGAKSLRRLDPLSTRGVLCGSCGWRDEEASSFFLAEAEGPLEEIVLYQRRQGKPPQS